MMSCTRGWIVAVALIAGCGSKDEPVGPAPAAGSAAAAAAPTPAARPVEGSAQPAPPPAPAPAPPAPAAGSTIVLPAAVHKLSEILGVAVGEPGLTKAPECCLDCEGFVPELQRLAALGTSLAGPVTAAQLRAAGTQVAAAPWKTLLESTAYSDKTRKQVVRTVTALADQLAATATAVEAGSGAARQADQVAKAVTQLLAAAKKLGGESTHYCAND